MPAFGEDERERAEGDAVCLRCVHSLRTLKQQAATRARSAPDSALAAHPIGSIGRAVLPPRAVSVPLGQRRERAGR
eukprot:3806741-Rhodomonas_salina.3